MNSRVLLVDDERHTLAPLAESLASTGEDLLTRLIQPEGTDSSVQETAAYDAIVCRYETYTTEGRELIDRIRDAQTGPVTTIVIATAEQAGSDDVADAPGIDSVLRLDRESDAEYQQVATAIRETLRRDTVETPVAGSAIELPDALAESEEAILLVEDDVFVDCTEAAAQFLGYESSDAIRGRHPAELSPPTQPDGRNSREKVNEVIGVAQQGGYHRFRWMHRRADGRDVPVIVSLTPIFHEGKRVLYCVWREPPDDSTAPTPEMDDPEIEESVASSEAKTQVLVIADGDADVELATAIDRSDASITATAVPTANEALLALDSRDDIDGVVLSSQLPERDAKHLVDRIRDADPALPAVRVRSGETDRDVEFEREQALEATLVEAIRSEVEEESHRDHEAGPQRYQTAFEGLPDPVAFFDTHDVTFGNEAFEAAVGRPAEALREVSFVETTVHPDDRDRFRRILDDWERGEDDQLRHVVRLQSRDGTVRSYEVSGTTVTITGTEGVLVSFRDVTDRQRTQQENEFERALYRIVLDRIADVRTRSELEAGVVEGLVTRGYDLAWIGTLDGTDLRPRAVGGDREFIAALGSALEETRQVAEPFVRAGRAGELQYVADVETLLPTGWRDAALERGYRSAFAVPLSYHDVYYGVLAIYSREPDPFSDRDRRLLAQFADAIAFASHSLELENALATDAVTEATITVDDDAYYLVDLARDGAFDDYGNLRVVGSVPRGDTAALQYVTAHGSTSVLQERLAGHPAVTDVSVVAEGTPVRLQVTVTDPVPEGLLAGQGVVVTETAIDRDGAALSIEAPAKATLQSIADRLDGEYDGVAVRSSSTREREAREWTGDCIQRADLTDKQLTALQAAHYNGYFERPRQTTANEIAASLGVSHSTFLQHLHRAQTKLFESHFG
jgi:PAS domain S-box-containing protein